MKEYFEQMLEDITYSINSLDYKAFEQLIEESVKTIKNGNKIIASGLGKNVPICDKFIGSMVSLGLPAYFLHTNSAVHGDIGLVKENDIVIILTKSGETQESIYLERQLRKHKANIWLLSFEHKSTLADRIDKKIILDLKHEGDMWNIMPNNSTTMNLIILQGLAMNIAKRMDITLDDFKLNHPGGHIGELLNEQ